jgi:tetratricopeptide (TPR) repeat protein
VIESKWEYPPAYYLYALCFYDRGLKKETREILEQSLAIKPVYPTSYVVLSVLYLKASDTTRAGEFERLAIQQAGSFRRDLLRIYGTMAYFCMAESLYSKAVDYYGRAIAISPIDAARLSYRGEAYFRMGAFDSARLDFERALTIDSSLYDVHRWLGRVFETAGDTSRALLHYRLFFKRDSVSEAANEVRQKLLKHSKQ